MKAKIWKSVALVLALMCILCFPIGVSAAAQGTNGDELQVAEPEQLTIQLGENWAGVEFELKTDAGMYPGTIKVGDDGVLRLEIGGSKNYTLSCLNSSVPAPDPDSSDLQETEPNVPTHQTDPETDATVVPSMPNVSENDAQPENDQTDNSAGIPTTHLVIFVAGLVVAIGILVGLRFLPKRHASSFEYDDDDEE